MRRIGISLLLSLGIFYAGAQDNPSDTAWKSGGLFGLQFTQASYSNWQAGGVNSLAGNGLASLFAAYDDGGDWTWMNTLDVAFGLNKQDSLLIKTDDRLELKSRLDRSISDHWSISGLLNFRTQFADGYSEPGQREDSMRISTFMAPGYLITGLGFTYKPNKKFSAFLSPLTSKMTFVQDEKLSNQGAFGVDTGSTFRYEIGGYIDMIYKTPLMKNVDLQTSLNLYSNYLDGNYKYIDVAGEMLLFMKVNSAISANLSLNVLYDHDINIDTDNDGEGDGPRTQFKEVLGVGITYQIGDSRKKTEG